MCIKKRYLPLLVMFLVLPVFSQTWEEDSLVVRQILDTNGLYNVPVDSVVTKKDSNGRAKFLILTKWPSFHILPASIKQLDNLVKLSIFKTNLTIIPPEIGYLKTLSILDLTSNKIITIPLEIGNLDSLRRLNISDNEITAIPPEIGNCKKLYLFQFGENKITSIPDEICDIDSLEQIYASNNLITYVPENIGYMPVFHSIDLEYNKLKHIPNSLIPYTLDDVRLCYNDSLVFTEEQKAAWAVEDYDDYFWKYCPVEVEENVNNNHTNDARIYITTQAIFLRVNCTGHITCSVYNLCGRRIETLVNGVLSAGTHSLSWNRAHYAPGVYFVRYYSAEGNLSSKTVVIK